MGRRRLPDEVKISPAEAAKRYRQKNAKKVLTYERGRREQRKVARTSKTLVVKMNFKASMFSASNSKNMGKILKISTFKKYTFRLDVQ